MRPVLKTVIIAALVCSALLLTACGAQNTQSAPGGGAAGGVMPAGAAPAGGAPTGAVPTATASATSSATKAPSPAAPSPSAQPSPKASQSADKPKDATWVVDINDTQKYTDSMGIIWNYKLTFHASKPGGKNPTGEFMGDAHLKIEPDFASVQAAAASEGTKVLSMVFNYYADCERLSFVVEKVTAPEPLAPLTNADFTAEGSAVFKGTQEPIDMTILHDGKPKTGSGGGGGGHGQRAFHHRDGRRVGAP